MEREVSSLLFSGPGATALNRTEKDPVSKVLPLKGLEKKTRFSVVIRTQNKTNPMREKQERGTWHMNRVVRHGRSEEMTFSQDPNEGKRQRN